MSSLCSLLPCGPRLIWNKAQSLCNGSAVCGRSLPVFSDLILLPWLASQARPPQGLGLVSRSHSSRWEGLSPLPCFAQKLPSQWALLWRTYLTCAQVAALLPSVLALLFSRSLVTFQHIIYFPYLVYCHFSHLVWNLFVLLLFLLLLYSQHLDVCLAYTVKKYLLTE